MSIFQQLFGNKPQQAATPQQAQQPQSQQPTPNQHIQHNNQVPNGSNTPVQQPTPENPNPQSPNQEFADLWSNTSQQQQGQEPNFRLDPAKLNEQLANASFTGAIKPEQVQKILAGGEEAVGALMDVLNTFGRDVFSKSANFSSNMAENSYAHATRSVKNGLPDLVKSTLSQQELFTANPKLRDPALQPMVQAIQGQIQAKHPNASPGEVNAMVNQYFDRVKGAFTKEEAPQQKNNTADAADFSSFLG